MSDHNQLDQTLFDAATYWANKPIKKFVVCLVSRANDEQEQRIFAANCSDRASELALHNSDLQSPAVKEIRLATLADLELESMPAVIKLKEPSPSEWRQILLQQTLTARKVMPLITGNTSKMLPHIRPLAAALIDCLVQMQACEQHQAKPEAWPNPVGSEAWDIAVAVAALALKGVEAYDNPVAVTKKESE